MADSRLSPRLPAGLAAVLASVLVLAMLTACGGDPTPSPPSASASATPTVAALKPAWTAPWAGSDVEKTFAAGDRVVIATQTRLFGVAADSGRRAWSLPIGSLCAISDPRSRDGVFAVSWSVRGPEGACRWLGAVDPASGKWLWKRQLKTPMENPTDHTTTPLAIGDRTVTVITECCYSTVTRYDLATGRPLKAPVTDVSGWGGEIATDGQVTAIASLLDVHKSVVRLALYDSDSGRLLWRRKVRDAVDDNVASDVVSSDPLIIRTSQRGHVLMWRVDKRTGRLEKPIGPQFTDVDPPDLGSYGVHHGTLVVALGQQPSLATGEGGLAAYDVATGKERWSGFPAGGGFVGFDDTDSMVVLNSGSPLSGGAVVTRHEVDDPHDYVVLGTVTNAAFGYAGVVGNLLLVEGDKGLTAYELPTHGQHLDLKLPDQSWEDSVLDNQQVDAKRWRPGDIRPGRVTTCHPSKATLRELGFHRLGLPEMYGCEWFERDEPLGVERKLQIGYEIDAPLKGKPASAVGRAHSSILRLSHRAPYDDEPVDAGPYVPVRGLGDEAYVSTVNGPGVYGDAHLLVRVRNVVVEVNMTGKVDVDDNGGGESVPTYTFEDGALAAAADILGEAGLGLGTLPKQAAGGRFTTLKPMCRMLSAIGRTYIVGGKTLDERAENDRAKRTGGCYWGSGDASLTRTEKGTEHHRYLAITAYATPGSRLGGLTGRQVAKSAIDVLHAKHRGGSTDIYYPKPQVLSGIGDEAVLFPTDDWMTDSKVVVRVDNLLIQVSWNDQANEDLAARNARAVEIARQVAERFA